MTTIRFKGSRNRRFGALRGLAYVAVSLLCAALAVVSVLLGGAVALP